MTVACLHAKKPNLRRPHVRFPGPDGGYTRARTVHRAKRQPKSVAVYQQRAVGGSHQLGMTLILCIAHCDGT
jgi:hypothetical protein